MQIQLNINKRYKIKTHKGYKDFVGVKKSISDNTVKIYFDNGSNIETTDSHLLLTKNDIFVKAKDVVVGEIVKSDNGIVVVVDKEIFNTPHRDFYDVVHVDGDDTYFTNGVVSHNCSFIGSSDTLISTQSLSNLVVKNPITTTEYLKQYEKPKDGHTYCLIGDTGRGKNLDYSAFSVIDVTSMPYKQVCTYRNNQIGAVDYAAVIGKIAKNYNESTVLLELNDLGQQVSDTLWMDLGYENILSTQTMGRSGKRISGGFGKNVDRGIFTSEKVKIIGCSILKLLIEQQQLIICDEATIAELKRFSKKNNSYAAEKGAHDDTVMCLVLFAWLSDQGYFREITDIHTLQMLRETTDDDLNSMILPFFFTSSYGEDDQYWKPV